MRVIETTLPGILVIEPKRFSDNRGYFYENFNTKHAGSVRDTIFVQDNISYSKKNVLRGLHYQLHHPQAKLVTVIKGTVYDVVVDIRKNSPTFKQWIGIELSEHNGKQLFIPPGFAHGFCVLSEEVYFYYKCSDHYQPTDEQGLLWNDRELNISWPISSPILSAKDGVYPELSAIPDKYLPVTGSIHA